MAEIKGDEEPVEPAQVQKLLRQAHDRELIDLAKEDDGAYTVKLRDATPSPETPRAEPAAVTDADEALDPPMPESSAPPSMRPANAPAGVPARSARFRRGSRGPRVAPPDMPKIGVVEMDPNFKPRIELVPPKPPAAPAVPEPLGGDSAPAGDAERSARSRGGRGGRGGRGRATRRDERAEAGERAERGDRSLPRHDRPRVPRLRRTPHAPQRQPVRASGHGVRLFHLWDALVPECGDRARRASRRRPDPRAGAHRGTGDDAAAARGGADPR